jgi:drug/metabolite transporter (DMT)-like permease
LAALIAAALFGASAPFAKRLLVGSSPQALAGLLYIGSGVGLLVLRSLRVRSLRTEKSLQRKDLPWLAGAILAGGGLAPVLLMNGLQRTSASAASLLLNLEVVFTASLAWLVFRERFASRVALGMVAILAGSGILSWQGRADTSGLLGPLLVAAACFAWAVDNNLTQRISGSDPLQITMLKGLVAGSVNLGLAGLLHSRWPTPLHMMLGAGLGFLGYGVSLALFVFSLRAVGTTRTIAVFSVAPFIGTVVSIIGFGEPVTPSLVIAGGLMAVGVWITTTQPPAPLPSTSASASPGS